MKLRIVVQSLTCLTSPFVAPRAAAQALLSSAVSQSFAQIHVHDDRSLVPPRTEPRRDLKPVRPQVWCPMSQLDHWQVLDCILFMVGFNGRFLAGT